MRALALLTQFKVDSDVLETDIVSWSFETHQKNRSYRRLMKTKSFESQSVVVMISLLTTTVLWKFNILSLS